jgi:CheY-like chemotaxis protein
MDGIAATIAIRQARVIPVLFITEHGGADATARIGREMPDALILRKPVAKADLQRAVVRLSKGSEPN